MPRPKLPVQKKAISVRIDADLWDRAEALAFDELSTENPSQDPFDVNMSEWIRSVVREYLTNAEDQVGGADVLAKKLRAARAEALRDQLTALSR